MLARPSFNFIRLALGLSILLMANTIGTPAACAWLMASLVQAWCRHRCNDNDNQIGYLCPTARMAVKASLVYPKRYFWRYPVLPLTGADVLGDSSPIRLHHISSRCNPTGGFTVVHMAHYCYDEARGFRSSDRFLLNGFFNVGRYKFDLKAKFFGNDG